MSLETLRVILKSIYSTIIRQGEGKELPTSNRFHALFHYPLKMSNFWNLIQIVDFDLSYSYTVTRIVGAGEIKGCF
jgi:hypothetical protein